MCVCVCVLQSAEEGALRQSRATIEVAEEAFVAYEDSMVMVGVGRAWLYKFRAVRVFQVHNEVEGHMMFQASAPGRKFTGYGQHQYIIATITPYNLIGLDLGKFNILLQ